MKKVYFSLKSKEKKINKTFNHISKKYDIINKILSLGLDFFWRKKSIFLLSQIKNRKIQKILDIATGTGTFAILLANQFNKAKIIGLDPSIQMIKIAKNKIENNYLKKKIKFIKGYSQNLPFEDNTFDLATVSFGLRNFQYIHISIKEIFRILKPFGYLEILEFSYPSNSLIKKVYNFYSNVVISNLGGFLSNNYFAYNYLKESIKNFSFNGNKMKKLLNYHNFDVFCIKKLTFEVVSIYLSRKNT
ncbi:bifunctional demethylmenaquinone methyltransferase/2-methoxy-6-polyprenyl-1,4-benzoquinol methylase UbiE [Blattabacterium cuenoti]|uniref:bifunctional demethylmenaquinone methyltransferase/2-methoxy-6-polyprenyl-1,4-benzoquinol methylase UbiE n=1 Tax=Blattabacterium cuenoti TaxID=1653831 RepID=UPI00163C64E6|nr:bifunctional demethylmenaquinone methyltransferase/2-methoxy-6-polyprenyl-1,4-benzoquinol methylase UbiE [Blattabacterium cuenoti]